MSARLCPALGCIRRSGSDPLPPHALLGQVTTQSHQGALQTQQGFFLWGSGCCELGDVLGSAAVLGAESDWGGMTHPETSMKDNISSLQAALVPCVASCFSSWRTGSLCTFLDSSWAVFNNTEFQNAVLSRCFSYSRSFVLRLIQDTVCHCSSSKCSRNHKAG